jgi:hypothetical protein
VIQSTYAAAAIDLHSGSGKENLQSATAYRRASHDGRTKMATAFTATHTHQPIRATRAKASTRSKARGKFATFFNDLVEDLRQKPLQEAKFAKHDMFREHINAMSICYFALIVLLIAASLPILALAVWY